MMGVGGYRRRSNGVGRRAFLSGTRRPGVIACERPAVATPARGHTAIARRAPNAAAGIVLLAAVVAAVLVATPAPPAVAQSAKSTLEDPEEAAMFNRISDGLVCQCGCNMILGVCNHFQCPSALPMRASIEKQIREGTAEDIIVAGFVEEYGKVVLATPPPEGINLAAWVMPGFAVLIGLFLVFYFVSSWVTKKKLAPAGGAPDLDPDVALRIEEELKGME